MLFTIVGKKMLYGQSIIRVEAGQHCGGRQKGILKYVCGRWRTKDNIGLLLDEDGCLTKRDKDKTEIFDDFSACLQR